MKDEIADEVRKRLIIQQRVHWIQMGKPDFDFGNLKEVVKHIANFYNIAENLIDASDEKFERFFEKLYRLDKRLLLSYVIKNQDKITEEQSNFAKEFFDERDEIDWEEAKDVFLKV